MKVDYIIVGAGLAGLCMAHFCELHEKSFVLIDDGERTSSKVAGGMFNPVVLKRFTSIWESEAQIELANKFYPEAETVLETFFYHHLPIFRRFGSIEEQNNWFLACDNPATAPFLNERLIKRPIKHVKGSFYFGEVLQTGYLDVKCFVETYQEYWKSKGKTVNETFDYNQMNIQEDMIRYKEISSEYIVFAEGFLLHNNPFFNYLPLDGTKGELLYVKIPELKLKAIVKSNVFIIPVGNDIYKVGATYNWNDKSDDLTDDAKEELINGLEELIDVEYEILEHVAGIRPTVKDRRPLVGNHYRHKKVYILNGLGTRGVLLAPYLADKLIQNIENNVPLDKNIDVARYYKKLQLIK